jgi:hypothetical protein
LVILGLFGFTSRSSSTAHLDVLKQTVQGQFGGPSTVNVNTMIRRSSQRSVILSSGADAHDAGLRGGEALGRLIAA